MLHRLLCVFIFVSKSNVNIHHVAEPPPEKPKPKEPKEPSTPKEPKPEKKTKPASDSPTSSARRNSSSSKSSNPPPLKEPKSQTKQKEKEKEKEKNAQIGSLIERAKAQMEARLKAEKNKVVTPDVKNTNKMSFSTLKPSENLSREKKQGETVANGVVELAPQCVPESNGFVKTKETLVNGEKSRSHSSSKDRSHSSSSKSSSSHRHKSSHHSSDRHHHHKSSKHRDGSSSSSSHRHGSSSSHKGEKSREGSSSSTSSKSTDVKEHSKSKEHGDKHSSSSHKSSSSSSHKHKHHSSEHKSSSSSGISKSKPTSSLSSNGIKLTIQKDTSTKDFLPKSNSTLSSDQNSEAAAKKRKLDFDAVKKATSAGPPTPKKVRINEAVAVTPNKHASTGCKKTRLDIPDEQRYLFPKRNAHTGGMELDYRMRNHTNNTLKNLKYGHLMHVETFPNGGATVVHSYQDELNHLSEQEMDEFVSEYFKVTFGEDKDGYANHVMGIVHGAAAKIPDLIEYFAIEHPSLTIQSQLLGKIEVETMSMEKYREAVHRSYAAGTFRCGPLMQVSQKLGKILVACLQDF